ncbi:MAG TPA: hypothetical protein VMB80_16325 [Candidatus Acidoferrum sp.]|nr:hypothetical protein [Candidatus Acidoferrum sp.]
MKRSSLFYSLLVGLVIFAVGAFFIARLYSHPSALARKIAEANSVVVTNQDDGFGISIAGDDAKMIVQAVRTSNKTFVKYAAAPFLRFDFYKGTNLLASVETCGRFFAVGKAGYLDHTGTLDALMNEYLQRRRERDSKGSVLPTNNVVVFTNSP